MAIKITCTAYEQVTRRRNWTTTVGSWEDAISRLDDDRTACSLYRYDSFDDARAVMGDDVPDALIRLLADGPVVACSTGNDTAYFRPAQEREIATDMADGYDSDSSVQLEEISLVDRLRELAREVDCNGETTLLDLAAEYYGKPAELQLDPAQGETGIATRGSTDDEVPSWQWVDDVYVLRFVQYVEDC